MIVDITQIIVSTLSFHRPIIVSTTHRQITVSTLKSHRPIAVNTIHRQIIVSKPSLGGRRRNGLKTDTPYYYETMTRTKPNIPVGKG